MNIITILNSTAVSQPVSVPKFPYGVSDNNGATLISQTTVGCVKIVITLNFVRVRPHPVCTGRSCWRTLSISVNDPYLEVHSNGSSRGFLSRAFEGYGAYPNV